MGPRKAVLEANIKAEVNKFLDDLIVVGEKPFSIRPIIAKSVSSVVGSVLMSVTYSEKNSSFMRLLDLIDEGFRLLTISVPVNFIPALRFVPGCNYGYLKIKQNRQETASYFLKVAEEHLKTLDPSNIRDFVDAYLVQLKKTQDEGKNTYFSDEQLVQVMGDIFSAGLETVTSVLDWAVLFMVCYPNVQARAQKELDTVIGRDRLPSLDDLPRLPYMEATILEVLRRANVLALGNAHATLEDTVLAGYVIPKDTHIVPNLWAIHMDPQLWRDPDKFEPERFLKNGEVQKPDFFMPFSVGRRMCVGDTLTKMEVFLFLASLIHQFHLCVPEGEILPSMDGTISITLTPNIFKVTTILRNARTDT